jgi:HAD superfamily hydrolase (TIGR01509 family)
MIKAVIVDFSRTILFPKDPFYKSSLNDLYKQIKGENFNEYFELNKDLLAYFVKLKERFKLYIFTTGNVQNDDSINQLLREIFDGIYNIEATGGSSKDTKDAYIKLASLIGINPDEILFIDDQIENINAALTAGFATINFLNNEKTIPEIDKYLFNN